MEVLRERIGPEPAICVPVKADAYGHGAAPIAHAALAAGARYLAVATLGEGEELRAAGIIAPILLFSLSLPEELPEILAWELCPFVYDREFAETAGRAAAAAGKILPVHLKIDTGMGRVGCRPGEAADLARYIHTLKGLRLEGTATHLAAADSPREEDVRYTRKQLESFRQAVADIRAAGLDPGIVHAANSGAVVFHPDARFDMVRPGIALYGYSPGKDTPQGLAVEPVMELRTRIGFIKEVKKGESLSYGRTWTAPRDTRIATLPVGYADGLPRALSGNHSVRIRDLPYPLVGRICMDQCMVDLGPDADIRRWEEVTLFGPSGPSAADIASKLATIPYEITCHIHKRVPRVYVHPFFPH
jgi:alanine racemase